MQRGCTPTYLPYVDALYGSGEELQQELGMFKESLSTLSIERNALLEKNASAENATRTEHGISLRHLANYRKQYRFWRNRISSLRSSFLRRMRVSQKHVKLFLQPTKSEDFKSSFSSRAFYVYNAIERFEMATPRIRQIE